MKSRCPHAVSARGRGGVAALVVASLYLALAAASYGFTFTVGELSGSFDSTLSVGTLYRLQEPSPDLYGTTNSFNGLPGLANSVNGDDGDLNYPKGIVSVLLKGTHDLELKYQNWRFFARGYYFYDPKNKDTTFPHRQLSQFALDRVGSGAVMLDHYVTGQFDLQGTPVTIRAGRQVVSWGESTFIPNGINVINPYDVTRLRTPGSELREALLPVYSVDMSIAATDKLSIEALWMLEFRRTEIDPAGTYFSTNDFASRGGNAVFLGFGALSDLQSLGAIPRGPDRTPKGLDQGGLAVHYLATNLNQTDFGFYYLRYDSRLPVISAITPTGPISAAFVQTYAGNLASTQLGPAMVAAGYPAAGVPAALQTLLGAAFTNVPTAGLPASLQPFYPSAQAIVAGAKKVGLLTAAATGRYFVEYPEGINLCGVSFNTSLGSTGIALQGEVSYKTGVPLQVDDVELLFATLSALDSPGGSVFGANNQIGNFAGQYSTEVSGYRRLDVWQAQATATKVFGPMLGASQFTLVGEIGMTYVPDLPAKRVLRFDGSATYTAGAASEMINTGNGAFPATPSNYFPDKMSFGYQIAAKIDYNNVFAGINISPTLAFAHDFGGNTPLPLGNFVRNRKTLTLGAEFSYQNQWALELRYVNFFGGAAANLLSDRDYVTATVKYSF